MSRLLLPRRFEKLEEYAHEAGTPIENLVRKVIEPTLHIEALLRSVRDQGLGRFEFLLGLSGSGKTTFLRTLPKFFSGAPVNVVPESIPLKEVPSWLEAQRSGMKDPAIFVLHERDNPTDNADVAKKFFDDLRVLFRKPVGGVVLIWPVTDEAKAKEYAAVAWSVGRESVVDDTSRGIHVFTGLDRSQYYDTADTTTMSLNGGKSLEAFGLTRNETEPLIRGSETISQFYSKLESRSVEINKTYGDLLKERLVPRVWILLGGDDAKDVYTTVSTLTQGVRGEVDVSRLVSYLDDPSLDAAYLQKWKKIREKMVYLFKLLDVRVFGLYPNVCVGAVRAFGVDSAKALLETRAAPKDGSATALSVSPFFRGLLDPAASVVAMPRETEAKTANEYLRLQASASRDDKTLNKAVGECVKHALDQAGKPNWVVVAEKQDLPDSHLQPDVQVRPEGDRIVCLELTWRTTGAAVPGVREAAQNTLTTGHIQQYLLQKVLSYVDDLKL